MATSMLLRSLSRCVVHSSTSFSTYRCLTGNVKMQWVATSSLDQSFMSLASRQFSSKLTGNGVVTTLEDATKGQGLFNQIKALFKPKCCPITPLVFKIVEAPGRDAWVEVEDGMRFSLSQIGPFAFTTLKKREELLSGRTLSKAMIIVPSYFNDAQRRVVKYAATIAGFNVHKIVTNGPSEGQFPHGIYAKECRHIAILDLTRGIFDLAIKEIIPISDPGEMFESIVDGIKRIHRFDVMNCPFAIQQIEKLVAENRVFLSNHPECETLIINIEFPGAPDIGLTLELSK